MVPDDRGPGDPLPTLRGGGGDWSPHGFRLEEGYGLQPWD